MSVERVHQVLLDALLRVHAQVLQHLLGMLHRIPRHQLAHDLAVVLVLLPATQVALVELLLAQVLRQPDRLARRLDVLVRDHQLLQLRLVLLRHLPVDRLVELLHEFLLVARVVRERRGAAASRHHERAVSHHAHLRVAQRLRRVTLHLVHLQVHRDVRLIHLVLGRCRCARVQNRLRDLVLVREEVMIQAHVARALRLLLLLARRLLHLRRDHLHARVVQAQHLVLRQATELLEQLQLVHQVQLLLLAQVLAQTLRAHQRVRLLVLRRAPRLRGLSMRQLVQRRAVPRSLHRLPALRQQVLQVVVLVARLPQTLQLLLPRLVQLLHRDVHHCHRVQRGVHSRTYSTLRVTRPQRLQRLALHAERALLLRGERHARVHHLARLHADRLADLRHGARLLLANALRLRRRVLLDRVLQRAALALQVQLAQTRVDRLDAVRVHPRLRVPELAVVVAQRHAAVLLARAAPIGLLHVAVHLDLRLHRAAGHQRTRRQIIAVLRHLLQVVAPRLLLRRLVRLRLHGRFARFGADHLAILVGDDARCQVVLVVVVHQIVLHGEHEGCIRRVAVHGIVREVHARIGEVLLLLTRDGLDHLDPVSEGVLRHSSLRRCELVRHFLAILLKHGHVLLQLVLRQVLEIVARIAVLHGQRMVISETSHHCLHVLVLIRHLVICGSIRVICSHRGGSGHVIPSRLHSGLSVASLFPSVVSASLSVCVLSRTRRGRRIWSCRSSYSFCCHGLVRHCFASKETCIGHLRRCP